MLFSLRGEETADGPMPTGTRRIVLWCIALCITRCSSVARAHAANYSHRSGCNGTTVISPASARLYHELSGAYSPPHGARDARRLARAAARVAAADGRRGPRRLHVCWWSPIVSRSAARPVVMLPRLHVPRRGAAPARAPRVRRDGGAAARAARARVGLSVEVTHCAVGEPFPPGATACSARASRSSPARRRAGKPRGARRRARWAPELDARGFDTAHLRSLGPSTGRDAARGRRDVQRRRDGRREAGCAASREGGGRYEPTTAKVTPARATLAPRRSTSGHATRNNCGSPSCTCAEREQLALFDHLTDALLGARQGKAGFGGRRTSPLPPLPRP